MHALLLAAAIATPGFHEAKALEPAASFVAGKPVQVMCANSDASWHDFTTSHYGANVIIDLQGSAEVRGSQLWLSPIACRYLNYGASAPLPTLNYPSLAPSINTLTHEAIHLRGESDEGVTECDVYA